MRPAHLLLEMWRTRRLGAECLVVVFSTSTSSRDITASHLVVEDLHGQLLVPELRPEEGCLRAGSLVPALHVPHLVLLGLGHQPVRLAYEILEVETRPASQGLSGRHHPLTVRSTNRLGGRLGERLVNSRARLFHNSYVKASPDLRASSLCSSHCQVRL